jgi:hypothetical protein
MAPRSGIRGITLDDVANVAENGSSVMRGGYTFTRSRRPTPTPRFAPIATTNVQDLIAGMTATPLNTAGMRYSGYPTASAQEAAILGSIEPIYQLGEYARQLAEQQVIPLIGQGEQRAVDRAELAASSAQQLADAQARLDAIKARQAFGPEVAPAPNLVAVGDELAQAEADRDLAAYGAAMAARNQYAFAQPTYATRPATGEIGLRPTPFDVALADTISTDIYNQPEYQQQVAPLEQLATDIAAIPRYELAQQMATQYFGMDPALAAGMFTPQVDIDYMDMMTDYQTAQNLAAGINPNATTEDILLSLDPSGQRLRQYQEQRAIEAENKLLEGARTAAEEQADIDIQTNTGFSVKQAAGSDFSLATARGYLTDQAFVATATNAVATMQDLQALSADERKLYADNFAAQYLANEADPVGAQILLNILYGFTFAIDVPLLNPAQTAADALG